MWIWHGRADYVQDNWLSMTSGASASDNRQLAINLSIMERWSDFVISATTASNRRITRPHDNNGVAIITQRWATTAATRSRYRIITRRDVALCCTVPTDGSWQLSWTHRCFVSSVGANSFARQSAAISDARNYANTKLYADNGNRTNAFPGQFPGYHILNMKDRVTVSVWGWVRVTVRPTQPFILPRSINE